MSDKPVIRVSDDNGIFTITFNRPEKRNAMSPELHRAMHETLTRLNFDPAVRVLIITGEGESFCAGQDLKEYFQELSPDEARMQREQLRPISLEWRSKLLRLFHAPTIAAINGWCFGGAFSIITACDIAVSVDEAVFGLSEINFKNFPGGLVMRNITDFMRPREALYYSLTGEPFTGTRAAEIGLVTKAVPRADFWPEVRRIAESLREKDADALRTTKEMYRVGARMDFEQSYHFSVAKANELLFLQRGGGVTKGIGDFLEGQYRPGLGVNKE